MNKCITCDKEAEWTGMYCQECWGERKDSDWWFRDVLLDILLCVAGERMEELTQRIIEEEL